MEYLRRLEPLWLLLVVLGAFAWAAVTIFSENVITDVFGTGTAKDVVYCVLGFAGLMLVPRLLEALRIDMGDHRVHPHGV